MISIITPCKDIIKDGRDAIWSKMIDSMYGQTYRDFEHIVIDGASTDGTLEILQASQKAGHIDTLISEPDHTVYEAINKGMKIARGEYVLIMCSDDYFLDNTFFERSVEALKQEEVDFTHADRIITHRDGSPDSVKKGDDRLSFFRMPYRFQTMVCKKSVHDEIGPFDEKLRLAADYKFVLQVLMAGKKGYHIPKTVLWSQDGGISSNKERCLEEVPKVLFEVYGQKYSLTLEDCKSIYIRKISPELFNKIKKNIPAGMILDSLTYCYQRLNGYTAP